MKSSDALRTVGQILGLGRGKPGPNRPAAPIAPPAAHGVAIEARLAPSGRVVMRIPIDPDELVELVPQEHGEGDRAASRADGGGA